MPHESLARSSELAGADDLPLLFVSSLAGTSLREYIMQSPTSRGYRNTGQSRLSRERDEIEMGMR